MARVFAYRGFGVPFGAGPLLTSALTVLWVVMVVYFCWHAVGYVRHAIRRRDADGDTDG